MLYTERLSSYLFAQRIQSIRFCLPLSYLFLTEVHCCSRYRKNCNNISIFFTSIMRQVGLSIHAHSISDNERLGSFALRVLKVVWIYSNRTFFFAEDAVSESGYDGDNEASSSDSSDNGNQGNVRDMWDWLLLVYYVSSLMCRVCLSIHVTEAFRCRFDQIWFDLSNYNGFWCNLPMKAWIKTRVSRRTNDQYDVRDNK